MRIQERNVIEYEGQLDNSLMCIRRQSLSLVRFLAQSSFSSLLANNRSLRPRYRGHGTNKTDDCGHEQSVCVTPQRDQRASELKQADGALAHAVVANTGRSSIPDGTAEYFVRVLILNMQGKCVSTAVEPRLGKLWGGSLMARPKAYFSYTVGGISQKR